jgi:predicted RND superfamily exporter protein
MSKFTDHLIASLIRWRWWTLGLSLVLAGIGGYVGQGLKMDRSLENLFASDDPLLPPYREFQKTLGQNQIVLAVYRDKNLRTSEGLARLAEIAEQARAVPGVVAAVTMHDVPGLLAANGSTIGVDPRAQKLKQVFAGMTHNDKLDAAGIVCLLDRSNEASIPTRKTLKNLRKLIAPLPGGVLVGEPILLGEAFDLLEIDGQRLTTWCLALLLLTIYLCFRQLRWIILPLVLVQVILAWTRGLLVVLDLNMSMVSSMLASIITVVGIAAIMHVIVRYRDERLSGYAPQEALQRAGHIVAAPLFFACLTDALGFASLMISSVKPVADYGLMTAIGSLLVLLAIPLVSPAIILFRDDRTAIPAHPEESKLQGHLHRLYDWSCRHAFAIGVVSLVITIFTLIGTGLQEQETDFTKNFRQNSNLVQGFKYVDQEFGGAGVWDILVPVPARLNLEFISQILAFEAQLQEQAPRITKVVSLVDMLDAGAGGLERLSFGGDLAVRGGLSLMRARLPEFIATIINSQAPVGQRYIRIMLRAPESLEARQKAKLIEQVRTTTAATYPHARVTGYYVLFTHMIESLSRDQWTTFALAAVSILLVMAWAFHSFALSLATLIPNILPIFWLFGAMGWLGIRINMGAAMIAAVSVGLSVDGSIHYVMSYQRLRRLGLSLDEAIQAVQGSVGRAAVLATLALAVGFSTLMVSEFIPTVYFGTLVTLTMIGGLVGNLVVLPLLIRVVER